jgi:hypothetical protein
MSNPSPDPRPNAALIVTGHDSRSKGRYQREVRHLDCFGQASRLILHTRRFLCLSCDKSFIPNAGILTDRFHVVRVVQHHFILESVVGM